MGDELIEIHGRYYDLDENNQSKNTGHKQVEVKLGRHLTLVDEQLADLLFDLNKRGFHTDNSCQDNNGKIWISFTPILSWQKLVKQALFEYNALTLDENETECVFVGIYAKGCV